MKMIKEIGGLLLGLICSNALFAQNGTIGQYMEQMSKRFNDYEIHQQRTFETYRGRLNAEFAEHMRRAWPEYRSKPAEPVPGLPEPPAPVIKEPDAGPSSDPVPFDEVRLLSDPVALPQPVVPCDKPIDPPQPEFTFDFFGTPCAVSLTAGHRFRLAGPDENSVADAWLQLSSDRYDAVLADCLAWREKLHLPDWGYVRFVEKMTAAFFAADCRNEARLLQTYILTQSGYKVRIARAGSCLVLLLPSKVNIYQYPYLLIDNCKYYVLGNSSRQQSYHVFDREFPREQYFSLRITEEPLLSVRPTAPRTLTAAHDAAVTASVSTNRNLVEFYNDYPLTDSWSVYVYSSLSETVKKQLYPALRRAICGKNNAEAAGILLNFVQTAFAYQTDDAQFGFERPLFGDETLYYPSCDCEDRAILYSILVRELLGLDAVLLNYPGHLSTAVCFDTEDVCGDYLQIDGKRYIVCDPTYINADVGQAMPQYKQTAAKVIKL